MEGTEWATCHSGSSTNGRDGHHCMLSPFSAHRKVFVKVELCAKTLPVRHSFTITMIASSPVGNSTSPGSCALSVGVLQLC